MVCWMGNLVTRIRSRTQGEILTQELWRVFRKGWICRSKADIIWDADGPIFTTWVKEINQHI